MKQKILVVLCFFLMPVFMISEVQAYEGISEWASLEVEAAIAGGLVPKSLRHSYQACITRAEYVLLVLEIIEDFQYDLQMKYERPFDDILDHPYRSEIIKAYNYGLIKGYGDRSFRPESEITREEIASLLVNLLNVIRPDANYLITEGAEFADGDHIASWAKPYMDYCYDAGIMHGTGFDGRLQAYMTPKGKASREQSMVLLYRLALGEGIYQALTYQPISLYTSQLVRTDQVCYEINDFAENQGRAITDSLIKLHEKSYAGITAVNSSFAEVHHDDDSYMTYFNGAYTDISLNLMDHDNNVMIYTYCDIVSDCIGDLEALQMVKRAIKHMEDDPTYYVSEETVDDFTFKAYREEVHDTSGLVIEVIYHFRFISNDWEVQ